MSKLELKDKKLQQLKDENKALKDEIEALKNQLDMESATKSKTLQQAKNMIVQLATIKKTYQEAIDGANKAKETYLKASEKLDEFRKKMGKKNKELLTTIKKGG